MYDSELRRARSEVLPQIPELAPRLEQEPDVIKHALLDSVKRQNVDPAEIADNNINKAERHTIAGFAIGAQREIMVEGEGEDAQLKMAIPRFLGRLMGRSDIAYASVTSGAFTRSAQHVAKTYSHGKDPEHQWWDLAEKRYRTLGSTMATDVPAEGRDLMLGLQAAALPGSIIQLGKLVTDKMPEAAVKERVQAAHDLIPLLSGKASQHFIEFAGPITSLGVDKLEGEIDYDKATDRYRFKSTDREKWREVYKHRTNNGSARLKCPAHAAIEGPGADSNLIHLLHAGINKAAEYKIFSGRAFK